MSGVRSVLDMVSLFARNVIVRWRERRDRRRLVGDWLTLEVKTWESARRR